MDKPCNAADAPLLANPSGPGRFPLMRRCRLLIGLLPNLVGSATPFGEMCRGRGHAKYSDRLLTSQRALIVLAPLRPPAFQHGRRPLLAAESERERECKNQAPQNDEKGSLHDIAPHLDLTEGDHHDKGHDEMAEDLARDLA